MRKLSFVTLFLFLIGAGLYISSPKPACAQTTFSCCGSSTAYSYTNGVCIDNNLSEHINTNCHNNFVNTVGFILRLIPGLGNITNEDISSTCIDSITSIMSNGYIDVTTAGSQACQKYVTTISTKFNVPITSDNIFLNACSGVVNTILSGYADNMVSLPDKCPDPLTCNYGTGVCVGSLGTKICSFISTDENNSTRQSCETCFNKPGVFTPFGCIEATPQLFVAKILRIAIGISGGIAFLMIVYGGFVTMTSAGNPEKLTSGKEIITSAIAGLLLIIFSVVILKIIGVDILGLPGFGG